MDTDIELLMLGCLAFTQDAFVKAHHSLRKYQGKRGDNKILWQRLCLFCTSGCNL